MAQHRLKLYNVHRLTARLGYRHQYRPRQISMPTVEHSSVIMLQQNEAMIVSEYCSLLVINGCSKIIYLAANRVIPLAVVGGVYVVFKCSWYTELDSSKFQSPREQWNLERHSTGLMGVVHLVNL